jgi:hypothetical protein
MTDDQERIAATHNRRPKGVPPGAVYHPGVAMVWVGRCRRHRRGHDNFMGVGQPSLRAWELDHIGVGGCGSVASNMVYESAPGAFVGGEQA